MKKSTTSLQRIFSLRIKNSMTCPCFCHYYFDFEKRMIIAKYQICDTWQITTEYQLRLMSDAWSIDTHTRSSTPHIKGVPETFSSYVSEITLADASNELVEFVLTKARQMALHPEDIEKLKKQLKLHSGNAWINTCHQASA